MKALVLGIALMAVGVFTSCGEKGWTEEDKEVFMEKCTGSASKNLDSETATAYCECVLEKVQKEYPNPDDMDVNSERSQEIIAELTRNRASKLLTKYG